MAAVGVTASNTKDKVANATNKALAESATLVPNETKASKSASATNKEEIPVVKTPKTGTPVTKAIDALKNASNTKETESSSSVVENDAKPPPVNVKQDSSGGTSVLAPKPPVQPPPDSIYDRSNVPPLEQETMKPIESEKSDATVKANAKMSPKYK